MINITKLYCDTDTAGDGIRYGSKTEGGIKKFHENETTIKEFDVPASARQRRPVVVWNITRRCNLNCIHCYSDSHNTQYSEELSTEQAKKVIEELAEFKAPAILFSGGEPLMRDDIFTLAEYAKTFDLRFVLSTNGTLIDKNMAKKIKTAGFSYVGISLDGIGETNDFFRGQKGAFEKTVNAFRNCIEANQKVGLRLTLAKHTLKDLNEIFDFIEKENIPRACFYHLVSSGRGSNISEEVLTHSETRQAIDIILERTQDFIKRNIYKDILTVDNFVDGVYLYLRLKEQNPERAKKALALLEWNGGGLYSSGVGIGCIDYKGDVHPDQFWQNYTFGNIKERTFGQIWTDTSNKLMADLKNRASFIKGKCEQCKWIQICGGGLRVRAYKEHGDVWAEDPACYLTENEISTKYQITNNKQ